MKYACSVDYDRAAAKAKMEAIIRAAQELEKLYTQLARRAPTRDEKSHYKWVAFYHEQVAQKIGSITKNLDEETDPDFFSPLPVKR
jgi:hypothetical protein